MYIVIKALSNGCLFYCDVAIGKEVYMPESNFEGDVLDRLDIAVRTGLHCSPAAHKTLGTFPAGTVRFSVSYFTSDNDYKKLKDALDYIEENS